MICIISLAPGRSGFDLKIENFNLVIPSVERGMYWFHLVCPSDCPSDPLTTGAPLQNVSTMFKAPKLTCWHMADDCRNMLFQYFLMMMSVCPSVDGIISALQQYSPDPFHIYTSYQATSEGVSHVKVFDFSKLKNLKFSQIL